MQEAELPSHGKRYLPIGVILLVASYCRLTNLDVMEFKGDEAVAVMMVVDALSGSGLPVHGLMSSVGIFNPPIFIYLMMIPGVVSFDPIVLTQFVGLLNVAAVFLTWWFGRRIFGERTATISALFFAVSPWAVVYSRKIWAQDCIPVFSLLVVGSIYEVCVHRNHRWFLPGLVAAGLLPGLHFSGLYPAFLFAVFLICFRPKIGWKPWAIGLAVLGIAYVPYILEHGSAGGMGSAVSASNVSADAAVFAAQVMSHFNFEYLLGESTAELHSATSTPLLAMANVSGVFLVATFLVGFGLLSVHVWQLRHAFKEQGIEGLRSDAGKLLCWVWLVLSVKGYLWLSLDKPIYPHYLIILYPIQFWLAGWSIDWLFERLHKSARPAVWAGLVGIAAAELLFMSNFLGFIRSNGGADGDYGTDYRTKARAAQHIVDLAEKDNALPMLKAKAGQDVRDYQFLLLRLGKENSGTVNRAYFTIDEQVESPRTRPERGEFGRIRIRQITN